MSAGRSGFFKLFACPGSSCSSSISSMHLWSDSIWRAASSPLNKNLDRCRKVSTPLTRDLDGATGRFCDGHGYILQFLLRCNSQRRNCTIALYAWRIAVLVVVVSSRSSFMQPQRAQCFAHASMSRSADRALPFPICPFLPHRYSSSFTTLKVPNVRFLQEL